MTIKLGLRRGLLIGSALVACTAPKSGWGETDDVRIEEILVTASREGESSIQSTPLAVTAFSGAELNKSGVMNVSQLVQYAPDLNVAENPLGEQIYIRGIGNNNIYSGSDPDVTMQVDGVYIARPYAQLTDFLDINRVEVLRGPQGTLYGRNAVGGVINVISNVPSDQFTAELQQTIGNYSLFQTQGYVSGALVPAELSGSLAVNYVTHDPYLKNLVSGSPGLENANHGGARAQVRWLPTDRIDATTRMDYSRWSENQNGLVKLLTPANVAPLATALIGRYHLIATNSPETLVQTIGGVSEDVNVRLTPSLSLKSITAYRSSKFSQPNEADGTEINILAGYHGDQAHQFSQEIDLQGHFESFDFFSGLFYFREGEQGVQTAYTFPSVETRPTMATATIVTPDTHTDSKAVFSEIDYKIMPAVKLTVGARYTYETKEMGQNYAKHSFAAPPVLGPIVGATFIGTQKRAFDAFTPKAALDWQVTKDVMLYASVTKGFKSGGFNASASSPVGFGYLPEKIVSYETGIKSEWFGHRLRLNLTGFDYDYKDLQVLSHVTAGLTTTISNAATARVRGLELESVLQPLPGLHLSGNFSYLDARYLSFPNYAVTGGLLPYISGSRRYNSATRAFDAAGDTLNSAPKYSGSVAADYSQKLFDGKGYVRVQYYRQSRVYFDATNAKIASQAPYGIVNAGVGYLTASGVWDFALLASNLGDEGYVSNIVVEPFGWAVGVPGTPRTISFRVSGRW